MILEQIEAFLKSLEEKEIINPTVYEEENVRIRTLAYNMRKIHNLSDEEIQQALEFELRKLKKRYPEGED